MESFNYILPSNISSDRYRDNSSTNYTTVPHNPLDLQGTWEVGVKSVFYGSHIGDMKEKGSVRLTYKRDAETMTKDIYPITYKVTHDNRWDYSWRKVSSLPTQPPLPKLTTKLVAYQNGIVKLLNDWNHSIVEKGSPLAFTYQSEYPILQFHTPFDGFSLRLKPAMARTLGYQWRIYLNRMNRGYVKSVLLLKKELEPDDCEVLVFDRNVIVREVRIILKVKGESILSQDEFVKRWRERVSPHVKCDVEFTKQKLIIHHHDGKSALVFNKCLLDTIRFEESIFGGGTIWANHAYYTKRGGMKPEEDAWIVDVYKDRLKASTVSKTFNFDYELYPRQYTIPKLLTLLSRELTSLLQSKTGSSETVRFSLSDHFTKLELPNHVTLELTPNLVSMLGFKEYKFHGSSHLSSILPTTLDKREQEIFIYLDIVDLMNYGSEKRQMIQHFIHNKDDSYGIVEKFFDPIIYQPVTKRMIESLTIQLIGGHQQLLTIKDNKSIVTLHFRRVQD